MSKAKPERWRIERPEALAEASQGCGCTRLAFEGLV